MTWSAVLRCVGTAPTLPSGKNACRSGCARAAGAAKASSASAIRTLLMTSATTRRVKTFGMSWDWADPIRERIFGAPLEGDYPLERVDEDTYGDRHDEELRQHFPPDALFRRADLLAPERRAAQERVVASEGARQLADY